MSKDRSFFGTLAIIGIGAAAAIGTIAAYQHRKEIREKANEWAAITISRIKDAAEEVGITKSADEGECECGCTCTVDTDGDGVDDAVLVDADGDGTADYAAFDTDGDGKADVILADTDGDGVMDKAVDPEDFGKEAGKD
jgi:type II secretory pathway pseudopilin PulG